MDFFEQEEDRRKQSLIDGSGEPVLEDGGDPERDGCKVTGWMTVRELVGMAVALESRHGRRMAARERSAQVRARLRRAAQDVKRLERVEGRLRL